MWGAWPTAAACLGICLLYPTALVLTLAPVAGSGQLPATARSSVTAQSSAACCSSMLLCARRSAAYLLTKESSDRAGQLLAAAFTAVACCSTWMMAAIHCPIGCRVGKLHAHACGAICCCEKHCCLRQQCCTAAGCPLPPCRKAGSCVLLNARLLFAVAADGCRSRAVPALAASLLAIRRFGPAPAAIALAALALLPSMVLLLGSPVGPAAL